MTAPHLDKFVENMNLYGDKVIATLQNPASTFDQKLNCCYYDGAWVFDNLYQYTKNVKWMTGSILAIDVYRDKYVIPNAGNIPVQLHLSHGLTIDALKGSPTSKNAVIMLANNAAYARDTTPPAETIPSTMSREVAYVIMTYLNAEKLGQARRNRLLLLHTHCLGHFNKWFIKKDAPYIRPFMVALSCQALIECYEAGFSSPVSTITQAATAMWNTMWLPEKRAFKYTDRTIDPGDENASPDLNLLICPLYAWLFKETGEAHWRDKADEIFAGGVTQAYLGNGKQFNQNYRWSFKYLEWREAGNPMRKDLETAKALIEKVLGEMK